MRQGVPRQRLVEAGIFRRGEATLCGRSVRRILEVDVYSGSRRVYRLVHAVHDASGDRYEAVVAQQDWFEPLEFVLVVSTQWEYELQLVVRMPFETLRGHVVVHRYGFQPTQMQPFAGNVAGDVGQFDFRFHGGYYI